jgi:hypothetical protein
VNPVQLVIGDDHEQWEMGLPDGKEANVGRLPFEGGEGVIGLFKEASDCVQRHVGLRCFSCRAGAIRIAMMAIRAIALAKVS